MVRFKNRWFLVEFITSTLPSNSVAADGRQIWLALKQSVCTHFGDVGWGSVGSSLNVKYYSATTNICILRVARDHFRIAWAALTLLSSIDGGCTFTPHVVHISGTIKHAQMAAIVLNREIVARCREKAKTAAGYQDSYEEYLRTSTTAIEALKD